MSKLGEFIKRRRLALGLNQGDFAEIAGVQRPHLSQIESGRITYPQPELRRKIAHALGVSHLDMLVAAGELTPEEAGGRDVEAPAEDAKAARAHEVATLAKAVDWDDSRLNTVMTLMSTWIDEDRSGWRAKRRPGGSGDAGGGEAWHAAP